jgi:hypothetical protein
VSGVHVGFVGCTWAQLGGGWSPLSLTKITAPCTLRVCVVFGNSRCAHGCQCACAMRLCARSAYVGEHKHDAPTREITCTMRVCVRVRALCTCMCLSRSTFEQEASAALELLLLPGGAPPRKSSAALAATLAPSTSLLPTHASSARFPLLPVPVLRGKATDRGAVLGARGCGNGCCVCMLRVLGVCLPACLSACACVCVSRSLARSLLSCSINWSKPFSRVCSRCSG